MQNDQDPSELSLIFTQPQHSSSFVFTSSRYGLFKPPDSSSRHGRPWLSSAMLMRHAMRTTNLNAVSSLDGLSVNHMTLAPASPVSVACSSAPNLWKDFLDMTKSDCHNKDEQAISQSPPTLPPSVDAIREAQPDYANCENLSYHKITPPNAVTAPSEKEQLHTVTTLPNVAGMPFSDLSLTEILIRNESAALKDVKYML